MDNKTFVKYYTPEEITGSFVLNDMEKDLQKEALELSCMLEAEVWQAPFGTYLMNLRLVNNK